MAEQFRTEVPNIIDDLGLDPFERVLYLHYKRVCGAYGGVCYEAVRTTAQKTKMAMGMVTKARESLQARGLITTLARKHKNDTPNIMIVDIWDVNQVYYLEIGRPSVDGWTVEQLRQWVDSVHQVNADEHNPPERSPDEDSHNKRSLHERSNDELSSSEQFPPEMPVSVHKVNDNEHNNTERSPGETKKESSSLESYPNKESLQDSSPYGEGGKPPPIREVEQKLEQVEPEVEKPPPRTEYTPFMREFLTAFSAKRFRNDTQAKTIAGLTAQFGEPKLRELIEWAANKGMGLGDAVASINSALTKPKPTKNGANNYGSHQRSNEKPTGESLEAERTIDLSTNEYVYPDGRREPVPPVPRLSRPGILSS